MKDLNNLIDPSLGWTLIYGNGINDLGEITGYGVLNGQARSFLLVPSALGTLSPLPEPTGTSVLGFALAGLLLRRIRRYDRSSVRCPVRKTP